MNLRFESFFSWIMIGMLVGTSPFLPARAATADADQKIENAVKAAIQKISRENRNDYAGNIMSLEDRRTATEKEIAYIRGKIVHADKKLVGATATGSAKYIKKWTAEKEAWQARLEHALAELDQYNTKLGSLAKVIQKTVSLQERNGSNPPPKKQSDKIEPGESVQVVVTEDDAFSGMYQVRRGGYIIMPHIGRVPVAGLTQGEAETAIRKKLEATQLRKATVMVEREEPPPPAPPVEKGGLIYLYGQWKEYGTWMRTRQSGVRYRVPGAQPLVRNATVVTTVMRYGVLPYADLEHVRLLRLVAGKGVLEEVNVKGVLNGDELASDITLIDGDIIVVPKVGETNRVYVNGRVAKGNQIIAIPSDEELTAYKAILRAGGFGRFANLKKVYVLRDLGSGAKTRIPVNIKDVQRGRIPDVVLQANDIVVVPEKFFSF